MKSSKTASGFAALNADMSNINKANHWSVKSYKFCRGFFADMINNEVKFSKKLQSNHYNAKRRGRTKKGCKMIDISIEILEISYFN